MRLFSSAKANNTAIDTQQKSLSYDDLLAKAYLSLVINDAIQAEIDKYSPAVQFQVYQESPSYTSIDVIRSDSAMIAAIEHAETIDAKISIIKECLPKTIRLAIYVLTCGWDNAIPNGTQEQFNEIIRKYSIPSAWDLKNTILQGTSAKKEEYERVQNEERKKALQERARQMEEEHSRIDQLIQETNSIINKNREPVNLDALFKKVESMQREQNK